MAQRKREPGEIEAIRAGLAREDRATLASLAELLELADARIMAALVIHAGQPTDRPDLGPLPASRILAYLLDTLTRTEREALEAHLRRSPAAIAQLIAHRTALSKRADIADIAVDAAVSATRRNKLGRIRFRTGSSGLLFLYEPEEGSLGTSLPEAAQEEAASLVMDLQSTVMFYAEPEQDDRLDPKSAYMIRSALERHVAGLQEQLDLARLAQDLLDDAERRPEDGLRVHELRTSAGPRDAAELRATLERLARLAEEQAERVSMLGDFARPSDPSWTRAKRSARPHPPSAQALVPMSRSRRTDDGSIGRRLLRSLGAFQSPRDWASSQDIPLGTMGNLSVRAIGGNGSAFCVVVTDPELVPMPGVAVTLVRKGRGFKMVETDPDGQAVQSAPQDEAVLQILQADTVFEATLSPMRA